jgi:transmembrane sensor
MNTSEPPRAPVAPLDWPLARGETTYVRGLIDGLLRKKRRRRKSLQKGIAAALILAAIGSWAVPAWRNTATLRTGLARRQSFTLQDGSLADCNANTSLRTDFRYGRRRLELTHGEVFLSVATDPAHPFDVITPSGRVHVIGTRFNLRVDGERTELTLVDGAVVYEDDAPRSHSLGSAPAPAQQGGDGAGRFSSSAFALKPGEQFSSGDSAPHALSAARLAAVESWRTGRLSLDGFTLGEAVARFAQYHGRRIAVSPDLAQTSLGGEIPLDDLSEFLDSVRDSLHATVRVNSDGSVDILSR